MPDNNQQWPNPRPASFPQAPSNRPAPPPPPPPEITIRTMQSDVESLKQSGGAGPVPKTFAAPQVPASSLPSAPLPPLAPAMPKITPSDFTAPKIPSAQPEKSTVSIIEEGAKPTSKKILAWVGGLAIAALVGLVGYFYVFPLLFPKQPSPPPPPVTQPVEQPAPAEVPVTPLPVTPILHQSLLKTSDRVGAAQLSSLDLASLNNALNSEAVKSVSGTLNEVAISDANGQVASFALMSLLFPEVSADALKNIFEGDFTAALYADENGVWPAYILKLKAEASQVEAQAEINKLESSLNLKNIFLSDPGTPNPAGFRNGQANGINTRYLTYSKAGAAVNLAWSGDKLVISASYGGLKKILSNF